MLAPIDAWSVGVRPRGDRRVAPRHSGPHLVIDEIAALAELGEIGAVGGEADDVCRPFELIDLERRRNVSLARSRGERPALDPAVQRSLGEQEPTAIERVEIDVLLVEALRTKLRFDVRAAFQRVELELQEPLEEQVDG